ncbi:hypothetical protein [Nocardia sp. NPDC004750]
MDQRTRERLPLLPALVATAQRRAEEARIRLEAALACGQAESVTVLGETFTKPAGRGPYRVRRATRLIDFFRPFPGCAAPRIAARGATGAGPNCATRYHAAARATMTMHSTASSTPGSTVRVHQRPFLVSPRPAGYSLPCTGVRGTPTGLGNMRSGWKGGGGVSGCRRR